MRVCDITGVGTTTGNQISHSHRLTKRVWKPNLQVATIVVNGTKLTLRVTTKVLKTLNGKSESEVLSFIKANEKTLAKKVYKALRPKGLFILEAYTPKQLFYKTGGPADESLLVQLEDIKNDFPELNACLARECERFIEEGQGHKGQSAVVQFVGQK